MRLPSVKLSAMLLALSSLGLWSGTAQAALKAGEKAPAFKLMAATDGKLSLFDLDAALARGPVVVYFYPKAFTSGCSLEAHQFSEAMTQFKAMNVTVIGVSADDIATLQRFSKADCQGRFPVGADPKAQVARLYDARILNIDMAARVSYLITPDHKVVFVHADANAEGHVTSLLAAARALGK